VNGKLITLGYGNLVSQATDPIEKKPFYHFMPGSRTMSAALFGCNFRCEFCQNYEIAQAPYSRIAGRFLTREVDEQRFTSPRKLALAMRESGLRIMSYTYSDPIVWQDYMLDTAREVKELGGLNTMVTNGSFTPESLSRALPYIDAYNIDVKGHQDFYQRFCKGSLKPVLKSIETIISSSDAVVEVTTLVIEEVHTLDDITLLGKMLSDLGVKVWHLSRFFPTFHMADYRMTREPYLLECLERASASGIPFIYAGNSTLEAWGATHCPSCRRVLISSHTYRGEAGAESRSSIIDGCCSSCGAPIYGRFSLS
jgi:pyruvate formate lyase activating enzyme